MAKIKVTGVGYDNSSYQILVVLTEQAEVEGELMERPLGEASIRVSSDTEMSDIKDKIVDAAQGIMDAYKKASDKRKDIEEFEFPEIE